MIWSATRRRTRHSASVLSGRGAEGSPWRCLMGRSRGSDDKRVSKNNVDARKGKSNPGERMHPRPGRLLSNHLPSILPCPSERRTQKMRYASVLLGSRRRHARWWAMSWPATTGHHHRVRRLRSRKEEHFHRPRAEARGPCRCVGCVLYRTASSISIWPCDSSGRACRPRLPPGIN